jgi:hypothetical protein
MLLLAACDPGPTPIIDAASFGWLRDGGPYAGVTPGDLDCPFEPFLVEDELVEIRTDDCPFVTLAAPTLLPLAPGDSVEIVVQNGPLIADEEAEATVRITIGDALAFERVLPIPGPSAFQDEVWTVDARYPAGTEVVFHARNHGVNSYRLNRFDRVR